MIQRYLSIFGLFEINSENEFTTYNTDVNLNYFDWYKYSQQPIQKNSHNLYEIPLNLSDAALNGTDSYKDMMPVLLSRYQLRKNLDPLELDAYHYLLCDHNDN